MRLKGPGRAPSGEGIEEGETGPSACCRSGRPCPREGILPVMRAGIRKKRGPGAQRGRPAGRKGRVKGGEGGREPVALIGKIP
ncbi:MAG: hypothetical protein C6W57_08680 [Caldibacillus debilis]|nr:MAG: hypothetical protein C6W57_08680 [Caldibacillus debilis]